MSYKLIKEDLASKKPTRTYENTRTFTQIKTTLIITDKEGAGWWGFTDLFQIPIMRISMAKHISDLYNVGLSLKDILDWCNQEKALIKGNDPDKYEKLFALILEKEKIATFTADPIKQHLALCTVYIMADDEQVDYFDEAKAEEKLKYWGGLPDLIPFFLTWHNEHIQRYMKGLEKITATVSKLEKRQGLQG